MKAEETTHEAGSGPGRVVAGRYRLERRLAAGGTGAVYEARHVVTQKRVALKLMHPELLREEAAKQRFLREAKAPAAIGHEGIADVLDAGIDEESGAPYLAMELVPGESLRAYLRRADVTRRDALLRIRSLLDPLAAAHARGFVHRDLKPENAVVVEDGDTLRVKLLDFGIARHRAEGGLTRTGAFLGTLRYVSPEQARTPQAATPAADVWSVGVMLYEVCAGRLPFDGDHVDLVRVSALEPHEPLTSIDAALPASLSALVDRCLAKRPDDRPPDAAALATELARILADPTAAAALQTAVPLRSDVCPAQADRATRKLAAEEPTVSLGSGDLETDETDVEEESESVTVPRPRGEIGHDDDHEHEHEHVHEYEYVHGVSEETEASTVPRARKPVLGTTPLAHRAAPGRQRALYPVLGIAAVCLVALGALIASRFDAGAPDTFRVVVRVDPPGANLRLDGAPVGGSTVALELPRDGRLHLLEATAQGHRPASISFRDRAPAPLLVLERLPDEPAPPATAAAEPTAAEPPPLPTDVVTDDPDPERQPPRGNGPRRSPPPPERDVRYGANKAPVIR